MASLYEILKLDNIRLRSMIDYAMGAPNYDSCKSILVDALDGINGAANSDEIKGERETLRARVEVLEKVAEAARDVFSDELKLRATTVMPFNFNTEREVRDLSKLADKLTALYAALDAAKGGN